MKWSWKIGRFAGIDVLVHATFFLLIGWMGVSFWLLDRSVSAVLFGVGFILALFASVVLHEYGHALTARKYGIKTRDITLYPIGGVARLERMPEKPIQELWVAIAGPAVNVIIAGLIFVWLQATGSLAPLSELSMTTGSFFERLMVTNLLLVGFNLIPAFPMDGGRVLRALLALRMEYTRATQMAAVLGQGIALIFGFIGFFSNPFLLFIALFVWIGAAQESSMVQMRSSLGGIPVAYAMLTDFRTLSPEDTLANAVEFIIAGSQQDFPIVDRDRVLGVLTRTDVYKNLKTRGESALVSEVMQRDIIVVDSYDMLETVFTKLQTCECHTLPVTHAGVLVGLVTMDNLGEFLAIQSALKAVNR